MGKVTIYVPDELMHAVRGEHISMSPVCQAALEEEVRRVRLQFKRVIPVLGTRDIGEATAYYADVLGFTVAQSSDDFASLFRGRADDTTAANIYFRRMARVRRAELYIWVSDPDQLFDIYSAAGATVVHPPQDKPWGFREFRIVDPSSHELAFFEYADRFQRKEDR